MIKKNQVDQRVVPFHDSKQADVLDEYNKIGYTAISITAYKTGHGYILFSKK